MTGCVLTDEALKDIRNGLDVWSEAKEVTITQKLATEILLIIDELIARRADLNMPDADELLAIEEANDEAMRDALDEYPRVDRCLNR